MNALMIPAVGLAMIFVGTIIFIAAVAGFFLLRDKQ